jgi:hypothetical protein
MTKNDDSALVPIELVDPAVARLSGHSGPRLGSNLLCEDRPPKPGRQAQCGSFSWGFHVPVHSGGGRTFKITNCDLEDWSGGTT